MFKLPIISVFSLTFGAMLALGQFSDVAGTGQFMPVINGLDCVNFMTKAFTFQHIMLIAPASSCLHSNDLSLVHLNFRNKGIKVEH